MLLIKPVIILLTIFALSMPVHANYETDVKIGKVGALYELSLRCEDAARSYSEVKSPVCKRFLVLYKRNKKILFDTNWLNNSNIKGDVMDNIKDIIKNYHLINGYIL